MASRSGGRRRRVGITSRSTARKSILADPALRTAITKGIDRQGIAAITQRGLVDNPVPLNNHIFLAGQEGYQDNGIGFDPEAAKRDLDALGWRLNGQFREKDGRRLTIRDVFYDASSTRQIAQVAQNNLAQIGVNLELLPVAGGTLFSDYITPGNFDIAQFAWGGGDAFPLGGLTQIYASNGESNYGKIGSPRDRRQDRGDALGAGSGHIAHPGQRTRHDDLGCRLQPAAVPVARQRRGAQQPGQLRARRDRGPELHRDRLHEGSGLTYHARHRVGHHGLCPRRDRDSPPDQEPHRQVRGQRIQLG